MHSPGDFGFGISDLLDGVVVVVRKDAEPRRLALDAALGILEAAGRIGPLANTFRADEELGAVADARNADRRVNAVDGSHMSSLSEKLVCRSRRRRQAMAAATSSHN